MEPTLLIPGIDFALKHNLTKREMEILRILFEGPASTRIMSRRIGISFMAVHHSLARLEEVGLIVRDGKDAKATIYKVKVID